MNFVAEWCRARCSKKRTCEDCYGWCVPRERLASEVGISEYLVWILQNQRGAVTHPKIADALADFIGATSDQRDQIVHKRHRGTYKPNPKNTDLKRNTRRKVISHQGQMMFVVAIECGGNEVGRFDNGGEAARQFKCSASAVRNRCERILARDNEFNLRGVSFRYAAEWDEMSHAERVQDIIAQGARHIKQ